MNILNIIITALSTLFVYFSANQWIVPFIQKIIEDYKQKKKDKKEETISITNELNQIEEKIIMFMKNKYHSW